MGCKNKWYAGSNRIETLSELFEHIKNIKLLEIYISGSNKDKVCQLGNEKLGYSFLESKT